MTADEELRRALDAAWRELEMDALASDGPIRDSDVKNAIKRNRPHIEAALTARSEPRAEGLLWDYWRKQLTSRDVDPTLTWTDEAVMKVLRALVEAHDAAASPAEGHHPKCISRQHAPDEPCYGYLHPISYPQPLIEDAATPPAEGVDVERLARALAHEHLQKEFAGGYAAAAERIIAEYAALAPEQPE